MSITDGTRDHSGLTGLTSAEAAHQLALDGPNVLPATEAVPWWRQLVGQLTHFFALLLWAAGALAIVARMPQLGVAIFVVILVNGVFAFAQEYRAEQAAARLRDLLPRTIVVLRDGVPVPVDAREVVRGDMLVLEAGDRIPADATLFEVTALQVDTSTLTGESVTERPGPGERIFAGTFVVEGEGRARVVETGRDTRLAAIAELAHIHQRPRSPLDRELRRVVRLIARIAIGVGVVFFGLAVVLGTEPSTGFLFAIGVTVALVPEGLLPTVTLSLARGAQRMAHRNALVRRLESVETLGSTTFICTDKTGTLTRNQMEARRVWTPIGVVDVAGEGYGPEAEVTAPDTDVRRAAAELARRGRWCSTGRAVATDAGWVARGDPMEAALDALARRLAPEAPPDPRPSGRIPFDPRRRRMSVVVDGELVVKGAPETVLPLVVDAEVVARAGHAVEELAAQGLRVLAVARRPWPSSSGDPGAPVVADLADADTIERDLDLLGLVGLEDPPRPAARDALAACRRAGIRVAMVTGDHPATAAAIARETGLALAGTPVVDGSALPVDDDELGELLDVDGVVVARVAPEDKLRIAQALQARGHVVAMTGDGVNDGPALEQADIGVAMGASGSDVAREASDLVLLDDDFATIVAAIEQGRATYHNVRRFLTYHLTDNVAELTPFVVWALTGGRIPLALGVLQILFLDIGTDLLPALALGAEPPSPRVLDQPPIHDHLIDRALLFRVFAVLGATEAVAEMVAFFVTFWSFGWRPGEAFPTGAPLLAASGAAFATVVVGQAANALACRSLTRSAFTLGWRGNPFIAWAILTQFALLAVFLWWEPMARLLEQAPPPGVAWVMVACGAFALLGADTLHKVLRDRRRAGAPAHG